MNIICINLADVRDPDDPDGRSYRQVNAAKAHAIPLGAFVEVDGSGERLYVMRHTRDCDQTPLYSLGMRGCRDEWKWQRGYDEYGLTVLPDPMVDGRQGT